MKSAWRKHSDRLVDSCKHSSVNQLAAGVNGCLGTIMNFSPTCIFSNMFDISEQAVGPSVLLVASSVFMCTVWHHFTTLVVRN